MRNLFKIMIIGLIYLYRYTLSLLIGQQCRFYPTCSAYAEEAFKDKTLGTAVFLTFRRILSCHPWSGRSGYDPVPHQKKNFKKFKN